MAWIAALLLQAADGAALLKALEEKIAAAKTIHMEFRLGEGAVGPGEFRGELKLKGADKWALHMSKSDTQPVRTDTAYVLFDGRRTATGGMAAGDPPSEPQKAGPALRSKLAAFPIFVAFEAVLSKRKGGRAQPAPVEVKEAERETIDGRECRVLDYVLRSEGEAGGRGDIKVALLLDAKTLLPVRRRADMGGFAMTEEYGAFVLDAEIPDADFVYASPARLAAARAAQAARAVDLFTRFTGRQPGSLAELAERPKDLPAGVFWPEGGFPVPADPAGRPYALERKGGQLLIGGVPTAPATGRAVGAPTDRLRAHFNTRLRLQLLASAARAWLETYGEVPADLSTRPEGLPWPEGGWLPADPASRGFAFTRTGGLLRIQAAEPARLLPTREEIAALEAIAAPFLADPQKAAALQACDALGADDLGARQDAEAQLRGLGEAAIPLLESRLREEKDVERTGRLRVLLGSIPRTAAPWKRELGALLTFVGTSGSTSSNERNASASLKTLATAEADFRANDRDGNGVNDFWTGDGAGLYAIKNGDGEMLKLIELSVTAADAAPLAKGAAGGRHAGVDAVAAPKAGYFYRAMTSDAGTKELFGQDTGGKPNLGKVLHHNRFAFCSYPAEYGVSGTRTYILNENNTIFAKDTQGEPVLEWPTEEELRKEWRKHD